MRFLLSGTAPTDTIHVPACELVAEMRRAGAPTPALCAFRGYCACLALRASALVTHPVAPIMHITR